MATVTVISPDGKVGDIPQENLDSALSTGGYKKAVAVTSPKGETGWMPSDQAASAFKDGYTSGHPVHMPTPGQAFMEGATNSVENTTLPALVSGTKALASSVNPTPQNTAEKVGQYIGAPAPLTRMVSGIIQGLSGASQVPAAVKDIAADPNRLQTIPDQVNRGVSELLPSLVAGKAMESFTEAPKAEAPKPEPTPAKVITEPEAIKAHVVKTLKGKQLDLPTGKPELQPKSAPVEGQGNLFDAPKPTETVGTAQGAIDDTALFKQAKTELGAEAPISKVASRAQELKVQAQSFEKVFGQPLSNYVDASGKFNMHDFLTEVVKPGEQPVPQVISKVFGADGIDLLHDITKEPLHKWESQAPASEPKGGTARLKAKAAALAKDETGSAGMPGTVDYEKPQPKIANGSPEQYLRMVGADARSIMKEPKDMATVEHFRKQIREGKPVEPSELHMDENNNVVGGDGRHRALAALQEGVKKFKVKVYKHPFEKAVQ